MNYMDICTPYQGQFEFLSALPVQITPAIDRKAEKYSVSCVTFRLIKMTIKLMVSLIADTFHV